MTSCSVSVGGSPPTAHDVYELNFSNNLLTIPVVDMEQSDNNRFVYIEISAVDNPKVLPLAFSVSFSEKGNEKINLGDFALFPGDNPGKFIVATQGKIDTTGKVHIELTPLPEYKGTELVRVEVKRVKLIDEWG